MTEVRAICVYCGSSNRVADDHKELARRIGRQIGERGLQLVYGGGRVGLMGIAADSTLDAGGEVIGIIPAHIQELEVEHTNLTELHVVDSMHTRKRMMFDRSDAFVILPGGLGTLDEFFEIITWKQLGLHDKPVVVVNGGGYWQPMIDMLEHMIGAGFAQTAHLNLFSVVDDVDEIFDALALEPEPVIAPQAKWM